MNVEVKRGIRKSVILPTLSYVSETWTWNAAQQSRICAVEMSYLSGACGVSRWDGESNETVYEEFGVGVTAKGVECGVVEWVKRGAPRWSGHAMRMGEYEFVKRVYVGRSEGGDVRGRPPVKRIKRMSEYWSERV